MVLERRHKADTIAEDQRPGGEEQLWNGMSG